MDRETRNRIQRATQDARALLEREYAEQLEGTFDIRLDGTIAATPGAHLDARQRHVREKLVTAIEHLRAGGHPKDAVTAYLREAAFTTLNRFVALKMLEARGIVQECVSRGEESSGFKNEFTGLAPGLVQLPDHGYRLYIDGLFDEIGREVGVLFDRRDPASLLWPRRQPLLDLLAALNAPELASVWDEDETIGWVYQYFNSDDERRQMRAESQAPRNNRELAVRNQFFTPRHVVQFLTDNTLGRIWYEMCQGSTALRELDYLVRRPNEVFLADDEKAVADTGLGHEVYSPEDTSHRPVYVPFRALKDPRDIRVLDPACGSGHFLLYAFDLFLTIYEEAWSQGSSPVSETTGHTLRDDYRDLESLRAAIPGLIVRHNLHGIDIDPRCAQIAALALWMRAQRAYKDLGFGRDSRPVIRKISIAVAEPMPGEQGLLREFVDSLDPNLGKLVERVFERMQLAGEAGSLLPIEDDIRAAVRDVFGKHGVLFRASDEERWTRAEGDLLQALRAFADRAVNGRGYRRRLFTEDAERGLGFMNLFAQKYQVVLMNPPFGAPALNAGNIIGHACPYGRREIAAAFIDRAVSLIHDNGVVGAIATRALFFLGRAESWRRTTLLGDARPTVFADLGLGVLDAVVETAAFVLSPAAPRDCVFIRAKELDQSEQADFVHSAVGDLSTTNVYLTTPTEFLRIPGAPFAYWAPSSIRGLFGAMPRFESNGRIARVTNPAGDDTRFFRLWTEVPPSKVGIRWRSMSKGGAFSKFYADVGLVCDWDDDRRTLNGFVGTPHRPLARLASEEHFFRPGLTYSTRSQKGFSARVLPSGCVFHAKGPGVFCTSNRESLAYLAVLNSRPFAYILELQVGFGSYEVGVLQQSPTPALDHQSQDALGQLSRKAWSLKRSIDSRAETSHAYVLPAVLQAPGISLSDRAAAWLERIALLQSSLDTCERAIDDMCFELYAIGNDDRRRIEAGIRDSQAADESNGDEEDQNDVVADEDLAPLTSALMSWAVGVVFGRFDVRLATGDREWPSEPEPFDALPVSSPGMLPGVDGLPVDQPPPDYPIAFPSDGILVDDEGHERDLVAGVREVLRVVMGEDADTLYREAADILARGEGDLRTWFARPFFADHIRRYTRSRRRAPIYWQLATPSARYSIWLYYPRLTRDTLYRVLNDYVVPKIKHEERTLTALAQDAGPTPSASQRQELDAQTSLVSEMRLFREEVSRVAQLWDPDLDDGVIINFAPLWRLVPQDRSWQQECRRVWKKLVAGDYDWARLAMHLWPERVVPKCARDRSLAIAHGLEESFWETDGDGKWRERRVNEEFVAQLVEVRSSPAVKSALESLLHAAEPTSTSRARRGGPRNQRSANSRRAAARTSPAKVAKSAATIDTGTLDAVKRAIAGAHDGATKSAVVKATGISNTEWTAAIGALVEQGVVSRTGAARGTRYHLADMDENE